MSADNAKRILDELRQERKKGMQIRLVTTGVVLCMFLIFAVRTYTKVKSFDDEALLVHLQEESAKRVWPLVSKELDRVAADAVPAMQAAMAAEAELLLPTLGERLASEAEVFQANMGKRMESSLDSELTSAMAKRETDLRAKYPDLDEQLYGELAESLRAHSQNWAMNQLDTTFEEHIKVLQSINETVGKLAAMGAADREKNGDSSVDSTMELFVEIFNSRMNEEG